ncbi:MAG: hypothetical protein Fur0037_15210 [Planctomycetota bacterium]
MTGLSQRCRPLLPALLACAFAAAQGVRRQPGPPGAEPAPLAILVLTREPASLDSALVRRTVERVYGAKLPEVPPLDGRGDWLQAGENAAALRISGVLFSIRGSLLPWPKAAVPEGDPLRDEIAGHRGWLLFRSAESPESRAERNAIYRTMGRLVAAMLTEDCVAVALVEHGVFRPADAAAAADLVGEDVVRAFAPIGQASVLVLLKRKKTLDGRALRAACERAFGAPFLPPGDARAKNAAGILGDRGLVRWGEVPILLRVGEGTVVDPGAVSDKADPGVAKAVRGHSASLELASVDRFAEPAELAARYRVLCRLLAELWDEDCLALSFATDRRIRPAGLRTADDLRSADPLGRVGADRSK